MQSWRDWKEQELVSWMKAINIEAYQGLFQAGGMVRGCDLQGLDDARLEKLGVVDHVHRLVIVECLNELMTGSSSLVSTISTARQCYFQLETYTDQ